MALQLPEIQTPIRNIIEDDIFLVKRVLTSVSTHVYL